MQETTRDEPNGRRGVKCERDDKVKNNIERMRLTENGGNLSTSSRGEYCE